VGSGKLVSVSLILGLVAGFALGEISRTRAADAPGPVVHADGATASSSVGSEVDRAGTGSADRPLSRNSSEASSGTIRESPAERGEVERLAELLLRKGPHATSPGGRVSEEGLPLLFQCLASVPGGRRLLRFQASGYWWDDAMQSVPGLFRGLEMPPRMRIEFARRRAGVRIRSEVQAEIREWLGRRSQERRRLENAFLEAVFRRGTGNPPAALLVPMDELGAYMIRDGKLHWCLRSEMESLDLLEERRSLLEERLEEEMKVQAQRHGLERDK